MADQWASTDDHAVSAPTAGGWSSTDDHAVTAPSAERSVGGFLSNVVSSAGKFAGDVGQAVMHPADTLKALGSIPVGLAEKAGIPVPAPGPGEMDSAKMLDALVDHFKGRYGSLDGAKKALYEDPVGVAADVSTLFGGVGEAADLAKLGKVAKVAGTVSELTDPLRVAGKAAGAVATAGGKGAEALATSLRRGALKGGYNVTADPAKIAQAATTMGEKGISLSEAGNAKITSALSDLQTSKLGKVTAGAAGGLAVDPASVEIPLQELRAKYATQVNPTADLKQIDAVGATFRKNNPGPIPLDQAEALKEGTYRMNDFGTPPPQHLVATAEAEKALARGLKEELEYHMPELTGLNEQQAKLLNLQPILEKAVAKYRNSGGFVNSMKKGLSSSASKNIAMLSGAGAVAAHNPMVAAAGGAADVMMAILSDPVVKSRIATAIDVAQKANPTKWAPKGLGTAASRVEQLATGLSRVQPDEQ